MTYCVFLHEFPLLINKEATLRKLLRKMPVRHFTQNRMERRVFCTCFTALSSRGCPIKNIQKNQLNQMGNTESNTMHRRKVKKKATRETGGHILIGTFLKLPIFCEYCCEFMWGTMAYRCKACDVLLHKVSCLA